MRVQTAYGLSKEFTVEDGIDQGDAISPLLWKIFYDPLLTALQASNTCGYTMLVQWPCNSPTQLTPALRQYEISIPALAYMDDTIFLESSKARMQSTVDKAGEFFKLHDIFINGNKSDLLVINPSCNKNEQNIKMGQTQHEVQATNNEIRYLGVWIEAAKPKPKTWIKRLQEIVKQFVSTVEHKALSIGHLNYLVNRVLIPKLTYVAQLMILKMAEWETIFKPILAMIKQRLKLPTSFPSAGLFHQAIGQFDDP
jgi:hypothetical protein